MPDPNNPASYGLSDDAYTAELMMMGGMEDLGAKEKKLARQAQLANQLRSSALQPSSGKDFGSQMARALQGGMAGYQMMQEDPLLADYSAAKKKNVGSALDFMAKQRAARTGKPAPGALQELTMSPEEMEGFK